MRIQERQLVAPRAQYAAARLLIHFPFAILHFQFAIVAGGDHGDGKWKM